MPKHFQGFIAKFYNSILLANLSWIKDKKEGTAGLQNKITEAHFTNYSEVCFRVTTIIFLKLSSFFILQRLFTGYSNQSLNPLTPDNISFIT